MNVPVIGFVPPVVGVEHQFNTFRLGQALVKRLHPGQMVFLMSEKERIVFGKAVVVSLETGQLKQLCYLYGADNHTELDRPDKENSGERLFALLQKIYGPHIATETKKSVVVYLRRVPDEFGADRQDALWQTQRQDG